MQQCQHSLLVLLRLPGWQAAPPASARTRLATHLANSPLLEGGCSGSVPESSALLAARACASSARTR